jgi:hypothetical protein
VADGAAADAGRSPWRVTQGSSFGSMEAERAQRSGWHGPAVGDRWSARGGCRQRAAPISTMTAAWMGGVRSGLDPPSRQYRSGRPQMPRHLDGRLGAVEVQGGALPHAGGPAVRVRGRPLR